MDSDSDALETAKERMQEIHLLSDRKAQLESQKLVCSEKKTKLEAAVQARGAKDSGEKGWVFSGQIFYRMSGEQLDRYLSQKIQSNEKEQESLSREIQTIEAALQNV